MSVELSPTVVSRRFAEISWPAVFAALPVSIAVQLLLSLAGLALGVYAVGAGDEPETITVAAASWGAASMVVSAFIGGYVAGRCSGLRRRSDGVLHGIVSWAATTVLYAALAATAVGALTTGLFSLLSPGLNSTAAQSSVGAAGESEHAIRALTDLGFSDDQARSVVDQMTGPGADRAAGDPPRDAADAVGSATSWLSAALLLSLLLGILGGMTGVRGARRITRHKDRDRPAAPRPRILSRH